MLSVGTKCVKITMVYTCGSCMSKKKKRFRVQLSNRVRYIVYCESVVKSINGTREAEIYPLAPAYTRDIRRVRGVTQV